MILTGQRVPIFKLRPYIGALYSALLIAVLGGLISLHFFMADAVIGVHAGKLTLLVTLLLTLLMLIVAFSRYRFRHLGHRRSRPGKKDAKPKKTERSMRS